MNLHLQRLAKRVTGDPMFLAAALHPFAKSEGLNDGSLAARLGCSVEVLPQLHLCLMPRPEAPHFWQDIEQIATRFALKPEHLARVVRRGQSLLRLQETRPGIGPAGSLLAARDRPVPPDDNQPEGGRK
jgi:hypothetical protein